eukprot:scaffold17342_cov54-Cylindrotheca_fusiformis.AAC.1
MCPENQRNSANVAAESGEDDVGFVSFGGGTEHMCHVMADTENGKKNETDNEEIIMIADSGSADHV